MEKRRIEEGYLAVKCVRKEVWCEICNNSLIECVLRVYVCVKWAGWNSVILPVLCSSNALHWIHHLRR